MTVRGGSLRWFAGGTTAAVSTVRAWPDHKWKRLDHTPVGDIAVLELDRPMPYTPMPIVDTRPKTGEWLLSYGWGTQPDMCGGISPIMEQHAMTVDECRVEFTPAEVCTRIPHGGPGPCDGESGGPLVTIVDGRPRLVGLYALSFGGACGPLGMAFTYVPTYSEFIGTSTT